MFDKYQRAAEDVRELDLLPVMNLFMVLIPFLLMGAAFYHIGVIPTSLPTHTPHDSDVPKTPKTVSINLAISENELDVTASSTSLTEEELAQLSNSWPRKGKNYDTESLVKHLKNIKGQYPASNTSIVLPYEGLDYESLVAILDATRDYPTGKIVDGKEERAELFPVVVFSRLLKVTPEQAAEGEGLDAEAVEAEEVAP